MAIQLVNKEYLDDQGRSLNFPLFDGIDSMNGIYDVTIEFALELSYNNTFTLTDSNVYTLTSGSWEDWGFIEGAPMYGVYDGNAVPGGTIIDLIDGATMVLDRTQSGIVGSTFTTGKIVCNVPPDALQFLFNLVPNEGPENEFSLLDGEAQRFHVDIPAGFAVGATANFLQLGNKSGGADMFPTVERLADVGAKRSFRISTGFKNWMGLIPSVYFDSSECIKPFVGITAYPQYQNPAVKLAYSYSPSEGNTGFYDEVYNGGTPDYSIDSLDWEDVSTNSMQAFDFAQQSKFTARINGVFTAASKFNLAFYWSPSDNSTYSNLPLSVEHNLALATSVSALSVGANPNIVGKTTNSGAGVTITGINITQFGTYAILTGNVVPNSQFTALIESSVSDPTLVSSDRLYRLAFKVQNPALSGNDIRAVWLTGSFEETVRNVIPLGPFVLQSYSMRDHIERPVIPPLKHFTEDDVQAFVRFRLDKFQTEVTGMILKVCAVNTTNGDYFDLESFAVDFGNYPQLPDGTLAVNYTQFRGFKLPPTSNYNTVTVRRLPGLDTPYEFGIEVLYGTLLRWMYWLPQANADLDFFGNQTQNWFQFQTPDWEVVFRMELVTAAGNYQNDLYIPILDYDDSVVVSTIEYFQLDDTPITKPILGETCKIVATHTISLPWEEAWGQITVEPKEGGPRWLISTYLPWDNDTNNPLLPLSGEIGLKKTFVGNSVVLECLFDATLLNIDNGVSFTSRVEGRFFKTSFEQNRTKVDTDIAVKPVIVEEERRNWVACCDPEIVLADLNSLESTHNDRRSAWSTGDIVSFELESGGILTTYQPTAEQFPKQANAYFCTVQWRDVLISDGLGCYKLFINVNFAGIDQRVLWGEYELREYGTQIDDSNRRGTVRIMSVFNDYNNLVGIDFTGAKVVDTIRFRGRFGYFQPNTEVDNIEYTDGEMQKVRRENLYSYELRVDRADREVIRRLVDEHFLAENACWITDHNPDNHEYFMDLPVIFTEAIPVEHFVGNRKVTIGAKYEKKIRRAITHFQEDNPVANDTIPPPIESNTAQVVNSNNTYSASFSTAGPFELPDTQINVYFDGVLETTAYFVTLDPSETINIDL